MSNPIRNEAAERLPVYGRPGVDLHSTVPGGFRCEKTGGFTKYIGMSQRHPLPNGRMRYICGWCASTEDIKTSESLTQLNAKRAPR